MGNQSTENYGFAGMEGYDSSATGPNARGLLEKGLLDPSGFAFGVPMSPIRPYKIYPLTLQTNNLATAQDPSGNVTLTAGTGVTQNTSYAPKSGPNSGGSNITVYDITGQGASALTSGNLAMTVQRSVTVTSGGSTPFNVTVTGYDMYNQYVTCTFAGSATGSTATAESNKTFSYVQSVSVSADPGVNITVGTGDTYSFPLAVTAWDHFITFFWNNSQITSSTGFTAADRTATTTGATRDVRGSYKLQAVTSNGNTPLTAYIWINNPNNLTAAYGVTP